MKRTFWIIGLLICLRAATVCAAPANSLALIPWPQEVSEQPGSFNLAPDSRIITDLSSRKTAEFLAARLRPSTGFPLKLHRSLFSGSAVSNAIFLTTREADPRLGAEGYALTVTPDSVVIRAPTQAGLFYGVQTLLQLLPPEVFSSHRVTNVNWRMPCLCIEDWPRFKWRGFMLDVSRHFFNKTEVEKILDEMALQKMNCFHWHLTDDQGWRIQIKKYPRLTQVGAWRTSSVLTPPGIQPGDLEKGNRQPAWTAPGADKFGPDGRYGGFYTPADIREVVQYAAARHIMIVPEIEMPGHCVAALAAYPQFGCGLSYSTDVNAGVNNGVFDPSNPATFKFLDDVLTEVFRLFPGPFIHIGGDEVSAEVKSETWAKSPSCQALMKREGLSNTDELQDWFERQMEKFAAAHGKRIIGWSEIAGSGVTTNAVIMDWIGGGVGAARTGHDVVMTPTGYCYLDHYQSKDISAEPHAIGGYLPLEKVYSFNPIPKGLPSRLAPRILGGQANLWTEYIASLAYAQYMMFPRLTALAEVDWSPESARNFDDFSRRLAVEEKRLAELGVNYRRSGGLAAGGKIVEPPAPYGPMPSVRQLAWQQMEFNGFLHFTVNTFTDKEWGYGDENPNVFHPTDFNADQIVRVAKEAGMKGLILTCKHHDGFCLWPSAYTDHSVKSSSWEQGRGDVVRAISDACQKYGLKFGVYLSPWDRNRADYGTPAYITYYRNQLRELLTHYGPIFEVWFDGANGGTGYYGGAREKRTIDRKTYYDWPDTWRLVRQLQPQACIFSDAGPDIRWVGNESGQAGKTCWNTLNRADFAPGDADASRLNSGDRPGTDWVPAECDVSIRPGWFYHPNQNNQVRSPTNLFELYLKSVGRGATLLLNVPPDRRGQIYESDVRALLGFRRLREATFDHDLARDARVTASNTRGGDEHFSPENVLDGCRDTYWATDDGVTNADLVLTFKQPVTFNLIRLRECLQLGQRVEAFAVDEWQSEGPPGAEAGAGGGWLKCAEGTSIGNCRILQTARLITTSRVRLRIVKCPVCPDIAEFGLFLYKP